MIVAGLGCRKGTPAETLLLALDEACVGAGIALQSVEALATGEIKRDEPGMIALAAQLGLPLNVFDEFALKQAEGRTRTVSAHSLTHASTPSLSEAAALVGAGEGSELIAARLIVDGATCALARSKDTFGKDGQ